MVKGKVAPPNYLLFLLSLKLQIDRHTLTEQSIH